MTTDRKTQDRDLLDKIEELIRRRQMLGDAAAASLVRAMVDTEVDGEAVESD